MLPLWIEALPLKNFQANFKNTLDALGEEEKITAVIQIFGSLNAQAALTLLPNELKVTYPKALVLEQERFHLLLSSAQKNLKDPFNPHLFSHHYAHISAFAAEEIVDSVHREMTQYIFSLPMPIQASKALKCYSIEWLNRTFTYYENMLLETVEHLFSRRLDSASIHLSRQQQLLLTKHAALQGHGKTMSWMHLYSLQQPLSDADICLYSIIKKPQPLQQSFPDLRESLVEETFKLFFDHPKALLPFQEELYQKLKQIFLSSEKARQDAMFYIDQLHSLPFRFSEALKILESLWDNSQTELYNFLHAAMHFMNAYKSFNCLKEYALFLFEAIYALSYSERKCFDLPIKEKFSREPLELSRCLKIQLQKKDWGLILLRQAQLKPHSKYIENLSPFLNFDEHLDLIKTIQTMLGFELPAECVADILYYQTASPASLNIVDEFVSLKQTIQEKYLSTLALPSSIYKKWEELSGQFLEALDLPAGYADAFMARANGYTSNLILVAGLLQLVTYPKPFFPVKDLMPIGMDAQHNLLFAAIGAEKFNICIPFNPGVLAGPAWKASWNFNSSSETHDLQISILKSPSQIETFEVPLLIPEDADEKFFTLLQRLIKLLGTEGISEEDEEELLQMGESRYSISDTTVHHVGTPEEHFDTYINDSPLLKTHWKSFKARSEEERIKLKSSLFVFINTLHTNLKKSFYKLFN